MSTRGSMSHTINHPTRKRVIGALWHSSEPLSAERIHGEYLDGDKISLEVVNYHVEVLEQDCIVKSHRKRATEGRQTERRFVLDGPRSGEAIRRLQLTSG